MQNTGEAAIFKKLLKTSNKSCCFSVCCSSYFPLSSGFPASLLLKSLETTVTLKREWILR